MRSLGFGYYGFGLGGALDELRTVKDLNSYLDMRWNEASQAGASDAMAIYDSVRSTFSKYPGTTSLLPLMEWSTAYNKLKDAYTKIEAKRAAGKKEAEQREKEIASGVKFGVETATKWYEISKTPGQQTPVTQTIITPGGGPASPAPAAPVPKWILPVAIGGGVLFLLMMTMVMIKRNPQ